jgi:hypothetical protein
VYKAVKQRLNFASFTTKERLNFPATSHYPVDILSNAIFLTRKFNADEWKMLDAVFQSYNV